MMNTTSALRALAVPLVAGLALLGAGCGDDTEGTANDTDSTTTTSTAASTTNTVPAGVTVSGAWARTSPKNAANGAVYMTLESGAADALVKASVDPSVAAMVEIHETKMADSSMGDSSMGDSSMGGSSMPAGSGEMTMSPVDRIEIPAGGQVELKPGGYHIMLMKLAAPLETGSTIKVTLTFDKAAPQTLDVEVRDDAP